MTFCNKNTGLEHLLVVVKYSASVGLLLLGCAAAWAGAAPPIVTTVTPHARVERMAVPGGGELFTYFKPVSDPWDADTPVTDVPFVSILKDTMGDDDPANDRIRQVWTFTATQPSLLKRAAAAVPFLYHRAGWAGTSGPPAPIIDVAAPAKGTWPRVTGDVLQSTVLDPLGMPFRAVSRSYRSRSGEYRSMNLWRALDILAEDTSGPMQGLTAAELQIVRGRILLANNLFGGYVRNRSVAPAWTNFESTSLQWSGRNWELLRQRSEENGLYFQPVDGSGPGAPFALVWIDQSTAGSKARFNSKFLNIADPYGDSRIVHWRDYSEIWWLDETGSRVPAGSEDGHPARMIPLALYDLTYPRVPLLLVDFRDGWKAKRREMIRRATDDVTTSVLGWTGFGHWPYLAAKMTWGFVRSRHGAAFNRSARVRAYVHLRQALLEDQTLNLTLRRELSNRLDSVGLNPFDHASRADQAVAQRQYEALIRQVEDGAISKDMSRERGAEADQLLTSARSRALHKTATILTLGIYRHHEEETPELLALVDAERRSLWHRHYLESVLEAGPRPEVVADMSKVRASIGALTDLAAFLPQQREDIAQVISKMMARSYDEATRAECAQALTTMATGIRTDVRPSALAEANSISESQ